MKITSVEFRKLITYGHYENMAIGATAQVGEGEDPADILRLLKEWVNTKLGEIVVMDEQRQTASFEAAQFESKKRDYEKQLGDLEQRWKRAKQFLERFGVPTGPYEDCPF